MKIELKETEHGYPCNDANYRATEYDNFGRCDCESWKHFKELWGYDFDGEFYIDFDYNYLFRWDIEELHDWTYDSPEDEERGSATDLGPNGKFEMHLYFIHQRKGNFVPVIIKEIKEEDMEEISNFLLDAWEAIKNTWPEMKGD